MAAIFLQGFPICQLSQNCRHIPVKLLKFRQLPPLGFIFSVNLSLHQKVMILISSCEWTSQELGMLSSVTINCQVTKIVMNTGSK